ncbi:MAG: hypothetical protein Q7S12_02080 [bacterium]|nr:hypothetical protein [bacterium]
MTKMKRLIFGDGLMSPSLNGSKRFTVRKYREGSHDFAKDEIFVGEFKDGLNILLRALADTKIAEFRRLRANKKDTEKNGYYFDKEYLKDLANFYPDLTWNTMGAVIIFEILRVNDVPVVQFNEHAKTD